jgi:carbon-monoxide dehydrogenase small subunit
MTGRCDVRLIVNGAERRLSVLPSDTLIDVLRGPCGLTGAKLCCDQAVCGACTVLIDDVPVAACSELAALADGKAILTIEGLAGKAGALHPIQQAFIDAAAFQCGFCTSGMILLLKALLDRDPDPDEATLRAWIGSNVCRCTGYQVVIDAARRAARRLEPGAAP